MALVEQNNQKSAKNTQVAHSNLSDRVISEAPPCAAALKLNPALVYQTKKHFSQLPISPKTLKGLHSGGFAKMTDIQKQAIPHALAGRDVLGAAKTGSGKTLAFLIPILENLHRHHWSSEQGLGALVISPTRELSLQIFQVLRAIGGNHSFSACLAIGGLSKGNAMNREKNLISRINILICTPGRLLQHMNETADFSCDNLRMLVLDEADRLLEMGFEREIKAILDNLPPVRQTLLFSATQNLNIVRSLANLSLVSPELVAPHEKSLKATPSKLVQQYIVVEAHEKVQILYSFFKTHLKSKILVFVASRKQAQYLFEVFRRLRPGMPLTCVHGAQTQQKRLNLLNIFQNRMKGALITTDMCSRGLDIKGINWVINFDCPDGVKSYIHRVGRTARYKSDGFALLFLLPPEIKMVSIIKEAKIPIVKVKTKFASEQILEKRFASFLAEDEALKYLAQKAVVCYIRSLTKTKNGRQILDKIDFEKMCKSMGLPNAPSVSFKRKKIFSNEMESSLKRLLEDNNGNAELNLDDDTKQNVGRSKIERLLKRENKTVYSKEKNDLRKDSEDDSDFFSASAE